MKGIASTYSDSGARFVPSSVSDSGSTTKAKNDEEILVI